MKSGTYYLYEYKNEQKSRNVGFLKCHPLSNGYALQICSRGLPVFHNDPANLSVLYSEDNKLYALPIQTILCENHAITCKIDISLSDNIPEPFCACGFLIQIPDILCIAALENGIDFSLPKSVDALKQDSESQPSVRKIQRSELSLLPRKYWQLANNSFLMHGYYNYNHLLLIEENGHIILGVPGIYDRREARAAESFGFPIFSESYTKLLNLSSDEYNSQGIFGYWCRNISSDKL